MAGLQDVCNLASDRHLRYRLASYRRRRRGCVPSSLVGSIDRSIDRLDGRSVGRMRPSCIAACTERKKEGRKKERPRPENCYTRSVARMYVRVRMAIVTQLVDRSRHMVAFITVPMDPRYNFTTTLLYKRIGSVQERILSQLAIDGSYDRIFYGPTRSISRVSVFPSYLPSFLLPIATSSSPLLLLLLLHLPAVFHQFAA